MLVSSKPGAQQRITAIESDWGGQATQEGDMTHME